MLLQNELGTIKVYTRRHIGTCKLSDPDDNSCSCPKWIYANAKDATLRMKRPQFAAGTPSYAEACGKAQALLKSWHPAERENARIKAERARADYSIQQAVLDFLADREECLHGKQGTYRIYENILGSVGEKRTQVPHALLNWLEEHNARQSPDDRIANLSQITPPLLRAWRQSWKMKSTTKAHRWAVVGGFFRFCQDQGWIYGANPYRGVKPIAAGDDATGTGILSDEQWEAFVATASSYVPPSVERADKAVIQLRQRTFWELVRWSGMALIDAVQFSPSRVDARGVLRYHRHKLRRKKNVGWAVVTLPERVRELLKSIPLETDSVGPDRPFLQTGVSAETSTHLWRRRFSTICKLANITEIRTATGTQAPHPHALRDTFAVGKLRATRGNVKAVARMLGHANSVITEKTYLPWVKELDDAHLEICDEALVHDRALLSAERGEKKTVQVM